MADVFISYKAERRPAVHYLARVLENHGYSVWFDYALLSGTPFAPQIEREIHAARAVVVLWCTMSVESYWVREEAHTAAGLKSLITARIEPTNLPFGYGSLDTIDLGQWDGNPRSGGGLDRLLDQIAIKVGQDPAPKYRALIDQEVQWKVHRKGLAAFPLDEMASKLEEERDQQDGKVHPVELIVQSDIPQDDTSEANNFSVSGPRVVMKFKEEKEFQKLYLYFSPDGSRLIETGDRVPRIWSIEKQAVKVALSGQGGLIFDIAFSSDGRRIVTAGGHDNEAWIWDSETGLVLAKLKGHRALVSQAKFSPDGRRVVTYSHDKTARVWDSQTGRLVTTLAGSKFIFFDADIARNPQFSLNSRRILTCGEGSYARIWDAETGELLMQVSDDVTSYVNDAKFSPDGRKIVAGISGFRLGVWDSDSGLLLRTLEGQTSSLLGVEFSPDSRRVVTTAAGISTPRVWDLETGRVLTMLCGHTEVATKASFSPDGRRIITASFDKTACLWDSETGNHLATLSGHTELLTDAQFSPDGRHAMTASRDRTALLWKLD